MFFHQILIKVSWNLVSKVSPYAMVLVPYVLFGIWGLKPSWTHGPLYQIILFLIYIHCAVRLIGPTLTSGFLTISQNPEPLTVSPQPEKRKEASDSWFWIIFLLLLL